MNVSVTRNRHEERAERAVHTALHLARQEHPFAATIAGLALQSEDPTHMHDLLGQMYAVALDDDCIYLAELVDEALRHLELAQAS